jgi:hypothetical protein
VNLKEREREKKSKLDFCQKKQAKVRLPLSVFYFLLLLFELGSFQVISGPIFDVIS